MPLAIVISTPLAAWAYWLRQQTGRRPPAGLSTLRLRAVATALLTAIVMVAGFWLLEEYAAAVGQQRAEDLGNNVPFLPSAVITSPTPLSLQAPGVYEEMVTGAGATVYRTFGTRLLAYSPTPAARCC